MIKQILLSKYFIKPAQKALQEFTGKIIPLTNHQGIIVRGNGWEIVQ